MDGNGQAAAQHDVPETPGQLPARGRAGTRRGFRAVAMLIGDRPSVMEMEVKAHGVHGYEVMDSFRPSAEIETGDADLSLLTYLDCIEQSFLDYRRKIGDVDFQDHFRHLAFHTPFGGMVKGAHRTMMRKFKRLPPAAVEEDFQRRMAASLINVDLQS